MFKKRLEEAEAKLKAAEEAASKAASAPAPAPAPASPVAAAPATVPPELTAVEKKELEEQKQKIEELTKQVEIKSKEAHEQHVCISKPKSRDRLTHLLITSFCTCY